MNQSKVVLEEAIKFVGKALKIKNVYPDEVVDENVKELLNSEEFIENTTNVVEKVFSRDGKLSLGVACITAGIYFVYGAFNSENSKSEDEDEDSGVEESEE